MNPTPTPAAAPTAPTLLELARQFDRLDPEAGLEQRVALADQMKALLGERQADFERCHEDLCKPSRVELTGGSYSVSLVLPPGPISGIVLSVPVAPKKDGLRLVSLFHGAWNLLGRHPAKGGVALPGEVPLEIELQHGVQTALTFQSSGPAVVDVLFVRKSAAEAALRILAHAAAGERAAASPEEAGASGNGCQQSPGAAGRRTEAFVDQACAIIACTVEQAAREALQALEPPGGAAAPAEDSPAIAVIRDRVTGVLARLLAGELPRDLEPAQVAAYYLQQVPAPARPLSEAERVRAAAATYRLFRTLALQAQVAEGDLKTASIAWQAQRDTFAETPAARAQLDQATARIDQEIAAARAAPARHPNQLPGAIRRPPEAQK